MPSAICEHEHRSRVSQADLFYAIYHDFHNVLPKAVAHVHSVECGSQGSIRKIRYREGYKYKSMTWRIDVVDIERHSFSYTVIDGDILSGYIESISHEVSVSIHPEGGSIYKNKIKYHAKGDKDCAKHANDGKKESVALFKAIEAHILGIMPIN